MQRLEGQHAANHVFRPQRGLDPRLDAGDLGVEVREFHPEPTGGQGRRACRGDPFERIGAAGLERRQRRYRGVGRVEPPHGVVEVAEHAGHRRAVEAGGEFVEPAAAAFGLERSQFVQLVEAEGHHAGEGGLVDVADHVLKIDLVATGLIVAGIDVGDADQVAGVAAESDDVVGIALVGDGGQFGALVTPLDREQRPLRRHPHQEFARARLAGVEHAAAKQSLVAEEHGADKLEERRLAGLVGAVEHLHAGAEPVDGRVVERSKPLHVDAFDEHAAGSALGRFRKDDAGRTMQGRNAVVQTDSISSRASQPASRASAAVRVCDCSTIVTMSASAEENDVVEPGRLPDRV